MGDFVELLIAVIIIGAGLLSGSRKKKPQGRGRPVPAPPPTPAPRSRTPESRRDELRVATEELERMLQIELPGPVVVEPEPEYRAPEPEYRAPEPEPARAMPTPEGGAWQAGQHRGDLTVETLEAAGGRSHERFHDLYLDGAVPSVAAAPPPVLNPQELRHAIIWREILGPPVGLR